LEDYYGEFLNDNMYHYSTNYFLLFCNRKCTCYKSAGITKNDDSRASSPLNVPIEAQHNLVLVLKNENYLSLKDVFPLDNNIADY